MYNITQVKNVGFTNIVGMGLLNLHVIQDLYSFLCLERILHTYSGNSVFPIDSFVSCAENSLLE